MINLTRRRLLKFIGIGALATVVPVSKTVKAGPLTDADWISVEDVSIKSREVEFNPNFEYGRAAELIRRLFFAIPESLITFVTLKEFFSRELPMNSGWRFLYLSNIPNGEAGQKWLGTTPPICLGRRQVT